MDYSIPGRLLCLWDSPGKNTGVGCHFLLQGIFPTQGSNPRFLYLMHWQVDSLSLVPPGSPLKPQSYLQKQAPAQDPLGCRSRHTPRHASSANGCKATCVWARDPCSTGDQPDRFSRIRNYPIAVVFEIRGSWCSDCFHIRGTEW